MELLRGKYVIAISDLANDRTFLSQSSFIFLAVLRTKWGVSFSSCLNLIFIILNLVAFMLLPTYKFSRPSVVFIVKNKICFIKLFDSMEI
jgi:hypothetical protein